jgi:predicted nucleic-acid-binding Zn-ribbon protein
MRDGRCTKCGATTVRAAKNGVDISERGNQAQLRPNIGEGFRGIVRTHPADIWNFVCLTCGYLEWGIYDPAALAYIDGQWTAMPAEAT